MRHTDHEKTEPRALRSRVGRIGLSFFAIGLALAVVVSCSIPGGQSPTALTIQISDSSAGAKTLVPSISMIAATYKVSGTGPSGATFSTTVTTGSSATVTSLTPGSWTVNVNGVNAAATPITFGSGTAQVTAGQTTTLGITVTPIVGPGSLSLTLTWPAASVVNPVIQAQLTPSTGSAATLAFSTPSNGSATYSGTGIMNGFYTLTLKLYDGTTQVMGAVDVVQIVQGQTTSGTYNFSGVNNNGGVLVNITPNPLNPLTVTMSGAQATVAPGTPQTLTGSVPSGTGNVTYVWYVNGVSQATGSSFTLNSSTSPLPVGTYRIDVTAFTSSGLQAGSATTTIAVGP